MALATTFDLPNFVGELYSRTPTETPALTMMGGLTSGGREANGKVFTWQEYSLTTAAQPEIVEGAAPTSSHRVRSEGSNVVQIFQYAVDLSYTKLGATGQLGSPSAAASPILGTQPVQDEMGFQTMTQLQQAALDVEFTIHQGTFQNPTDNVTGRKSRGMGAVITTGGNSVAAAAAAFASSQLDEMVRNLWTAGAPMIEPVLFSDIYQKQQVSKTYGYAPESRNVGGVNIQVIETDVSRLGIVLSRYVPNDEIRLYEMSVMAPRFLPIPGRGYFFPEPLAKTKASDEAQLYGEFGLEHGPEEWHASIDGLATS